MNASQFAKAQKLFDRVKELDAEILEVEKYAQLIADKKTEIKLSLKINNIEASEAEKQKVAFDADGSLINRTDAYTQGMMSSIFNMYLRGPKPEEKKKYTDRLDSALSDRVTLQILGVLLADKMEVRDLAIKALGKIGITL